MTATREEEFFYACLVFCLERLEDGSYLALNGHYKPVNTLARERVEYEEHPGRFKFKSALSPEQVAALSYRGDTAPERIELYGESCMPTKSAAAWNAYSKRLKILAAHRIVPA